MDITLQLNLQLTCLYLLIGRIAGTILLIVLTLDRYKAISAPLERPTWRTARFAKIVIGTTVFVATDYASHST